MIEVGIYKLRYLFPLPIILWVTACSPIDSVSVFDDCQASLLIHKSMHRVRAKQSVAVKIPKQWSHVEGQPTYLVPRGPNPWHESINTNAAAYCNNIGITPYKFLQREIEVANEHCKTVTVDIIPDRDALRYRLIQCDCDFPSRDQWQMNKIFAGGDAIYQIRYAADLCIPKARQIEMSTVIKTAHLTTLDSAN